MLCPRCHTINRDNARFCKVCGMHFTAEQPATQQPVAVPQNQASEQAIPNANASASTQQGSPSSQTQPSQAVDQDVQKQDAAITDIAHEPTQILSPEEMKAYHERLWQKEHGAAEADADVDNDQPGGEASNGVSAPATAINEATPGNAETGQVPSVEPIATNGEPTRIPPPPPPDSLEPVAQNEHNNTMSNVNTPDAAVDPALAPTVYSALPSEDASQQETVYTAPAAQSSQVPSEHSEQAVEGSSQQETPSASGSADVLPQENAASADAVEASEEAPRSGFPVLELDTVLAGRYQVTQVVSESEHEHVYQVVDQQGYQHCWNCGSEQNAEGDEYCIDCGAALLGMTYTMHEYPATEVQNKEATVTLGTIVNTFTDDGKTYVIEQPQTTQIVFPTGVHLLVAGDSDAGMVRRGEPNEDSTLVLQLQRVHESISNPVGVFMVADGMGGHDNGQGASRMTVNVVAQRIVDELLMKPLTAEKAGQPVTPLAEDALVDVFKGSIEEANNSICQLNQREKTDMGSTVTGFMIVSDHAYIINVGDSRTYMLRDGTLYQLTNDHSLVAQLLAGGLIEPDDVYTHPQRSQIFRSLGDKLNVQVDDFKQQVHPGDILLSCSDGLWEMVRNPQITDILSNAPDPQSACAQLIEAANANGGEDNVSAVVVFVR